MTTITKYICDFCGRVFDNGDECLQHEYLEKMNKHCNDVVLFGWNKKALSFNSVISCEQEICGIYIRNESVIPLVDEICDFCGTISPWSRDGGYNRKTTGLYLYDEQNSYWYLPADKIEELKTKMKKYGVDA